MGLLDLFPNSPLRRKALSATPEVVERIRGGERFTQLIAVGPQPFGTNDRVAAAFLQAQSASYSYIYAHQPAVRRVVDYIARNTAQLNLKLYERVGDTERREQGDHPAAVALRNPNHETPEQQFIFNLVADWLVFDNAYILKLKADPRAPLMFLLLPPPAVAVIGTSRYTVDGYRVYRADGTFFDVPSETVVHWHGYNPDDPRIGVSKLETLRSELMSDRAVQAAGDELNKSGLGTPGIIERPLDAPEWSDVARGRFEEEWANRARQANKRTPVLEEGMQFKPAVVSPKDAQALDSRKFTQDYVASLYGIGSIPPKDEEERYQFYCDVLQPLCELLADTLDLGILKEEFGADDFYLEFDLDEKMMSDDRLTALTSAAGAPILTRNESRARVNLPPKKDGDELITPLNVAIGGKPSPQVMPIQDPTKPPQDGSHREPSMNGTHSVPEPNHKAVEFLPRRMAQLRRRDKWAVKYTETIRKHFAHQESSRASKKAKPVDPNAEGQNAALAAALAALMLKQIAEEGNVAAHRLGLPHFDMDFVRNFVKTVSLEEATAINDRTASDLNDKPSGEVFEYAKTTRAEAAGEFFATNFSAFSHVEAAKQAPDASDRLKRWVVEDLETSAHPEMHGETVSLTEHFSNGKSYPPYEHPRCQCLVEII